MTGDQGVDVLGGGRVGQALAQRARFHGLDTRLVTRDGGSDALMGPAGRPLVVATRNDDLLDVLARVPPQRHADLVFVQNGALRDWLSARGLQEATRGLLFFAVPARGDDLVPGPEPSPFTGPHAGRMVTWLGALRVPAVQVGAEAFRAVELEKLLWNVVFGLVCQAAGVTVGQACDDHADRVAALTAELLPVGERGLRVTVALQPLLGRMCAYSRSIPHYRGAVKEWPWRNGWFVRQAAQTGVSMPVHAALCAEAGVAY